MPKAEIKLKPEVKVIKEVEIPHLLVPGEVGAVLELTVKDKDGKVTERRVLRSKSFIKQFLQLLYVITGNIAWHQPIVIKDTGGDLRDISLDELDTNFDVNAASGDTTLGIIVGTGTTPPTINDYVIETPIAHGTGAGELQYGAVTFGAPSADSSTSQFTITRDIANNSGGTITVSEIVLYVTMKEPYGAYHECGRYTCYACILRDVISGGIAVPSGQTLTVNYRLQAVV